MLFPLLWRYFGKLGKGISHGRALAIEDYRRREMVMEEGGLKNPGIVRASGRFVRVQIVLSRVL